MDAIISSNYKMKICYFPSGRIPGETIFSDMKIKVHDKRFTKENVLKKYKYIYDAMPEKDKNIYENSNWYKIYNKYKNEESILTANRDFLLCRDMNVITIWLFIIYIVTVFVIKALSFSWYVILAILVELVVTNIAMRLKGRRLTYNVIAIDISTK